MKRILAALICAAIASLALAGEAKRNRDEGEGNKPYDLIVIGSGSSSHGAVNDFTSRNKKVLVLEKAPHAGGCTHEFLFNGVLFEAGFDVDTTVPNEWALEPMYGPFGWPAGYPRMRVLVGGREYIVPNDADEWYDWLYANIGTASADILTRHMAGMSHRHVPNFGTAGAGFVTQRTQSFINSEMAIVNATIADIGANTMMTPYLMALTNNTDLHAVLAGTIVTFTGIPPAYMPAAPMIGGIAQQSTGFSYPLMGPLHASDLATQNVVANGGQVLVNAEVTEVLFNEDDEATGVMLADGTTYYAKQILSTIGLDALLPILGGRSIAGGWASNQPPGPDYKSGSAFITFATMDAPARDLGLIPLTMIWPDDGMGGMMYIFAGVTGLRNGELPMLVLETTLKTVAFDPNTNPQPLGGLLIITPLYVYPFEAWVNTTTGDRYNPPGYYEFKQSLQDTQMAQFYNVFPELVGHITDLESATPLTIRDIVGKPTGSFELNVGLTTNQRPNYYTGLKNLYFTGGDIVSGADQAPMTGSLAGMEMRNDKEAFGDYLRNIR